MLLGQADRAVQLLLETDAGADGYYVDCLRACLVASIRSSGASQSTIKLVATNLIANGKLSGINEFYIASTVCYVIINGLHIE